MPFAGACGISGPMGSEYGPANWIGMVMRRSRWSMTPSSDGEILVSCATAKSIAAWSLAASKPASAGACVAQESPGGGR